MSRFGAPSTVQRPGRHWSVKLITWPATLLLILGTVLLGRLIVLSTPIGDDYNRPFIHSGQMGTAVDGRTFSATVDSVRGGRSVEQIFDTVTTDGIFILVKVRISAYDELIHLGHLAIVDGKGNIYDASEHDGNYLSGYKFQPRIPIEGEILFEVPTEAATNLRLQLSTELVVNPDHQVIIDIALDITESQVASWFRSTTLLIPMRPEVTT